MKTPSSSSPTERPVPRPQPEPQLGRPEDGDASVSPETGLDTHTRFLERELLGLPPAPPPAR